MKCYLWVEHGGEADEEDFENAGFEQRHFVVLGEQGKAGQSFSELDHVSDGRQETLREILQ